MKRTAIATLFVLSLSGIAKSLHAQPACQRLTSEDALRRLDDLARTIVARKDSSLVNDTELFLLAIAEGLAPVGSGNSGTGIPEILALSLTP